MKFQYIKISHIHKKRFIELSKLDSTNTGRIRLWNVKEDGGNPDDDAKCYGSCGPSE